MIVLEIYKHESEGISLATNSFFIFFEKKMFVFFSPRGFLLYAEIEMWQHPRQGVSFACEPELRWGQFQDQPSVWESCKFLRFSL
jgi:hypothetical protein